MTDVTTLARSFLFVPGDRPERFDNAAASGADVVLLDLTGWCDPRSARSDDDDVQLPRPVHAFHPVQFYVTGR